LTQQATQSMIIDTLADVLPAADPADTTVVGGEATGTGAASLR
jgi:hypothetical protein